MNVSPTLRAARVDAGLTQAEVARRAGTSQPAVAAYESGRRTPTLPTLARLLSACEHELLVEARPAPRQRPTLRSIRKRRAELLAAADAHGVASVRVFGSVARRSAGSSSDVDLLVALAPGRTLVDLAAFREEASEILGAPVDVATPDVLKPSVRASALREAVAL